jgi:arginyl-tRNA synthetase
MNKYGREFVRAKYNEEKILDEKTNKLFRDLSVSYMMEMIKKSLASFGVNFDIFFNESDIYKYDMIKNILNALKNYTYEKDGATFLKTTSFKDEKDRVLIKTDGSYTYFLPDIAYHKVKLDRNYTKIFNI